MPKRGGCAWGCGIGLLVAALLAAAALALAFRGWFWFKGQLAGPGGWTELEKNWNFPAVIEDPEILFPEKVGSFERKSYRTNAPLSELIFPHPGHHGTYADGPATMDIYIYQAGEQEKDRMYKEAGDSLKRPKEGSSGSHYQIQSTVGRRFSYKVGPPEERGVAWWDGHWIFWVVARGAGEADGFMQSYLAALEKRVGHGPLEEPVK